MNPFTRLDQYIFQALWPTFGFGVALFSALGVAAGVLFDLLRQVSDIQLPLPTALQILGLQVPYFMSLSFPMAVLLSSLLSMSRLATDGELIALRSAGVSLYRLVWSVILFGLLVTGTMFIFEELVVPTTQQQARSLLEAPLSQGVAAGQDRNIFYQEYGADREVKRFFYAQRADGNTFRGLTILDFTKPGAKQVISAESARWDAAGNTWRFRNGTIYAVTPSGTQQQVLDFEEQQLSLPRDPLDLTIPEREPEEMTIAQAQRYRATIEQTGDSKRLRKVEIQLQRKVALPFTAVIFGLVGSSLGMRSRRLAASTGFGLSLLVVLAQYFAIFAANVWGKAGLLSPSMAAWLPNLLGLALGLGILIKGMRP
ncbi:LptF/LptG family permease [Acaryochloris thomasi]|uniref:LptF/LptG family permease n=1 Tax=Acaryochloris thomasi TaxID=2929456 RepID=UPI0013148D64|nr:LptF/LptG family permease [Acaryochloris thomasi]